MKTAYVVEDGALVRRSGERFEVLRRGEDKVVLPTYELEQLVLVGNVSLTPSAIDLAVDRGIDVVMLSCRGRFRARIGGGLSSHVQLRIAQMNAFASELGQCVTAKLVIAGKIDNQRALVLRHARRYGDAPNLSRALVAMRATRRRLEDASTLEQARGSEGAAASAYFGVFGALLRGGTLTFERRSRRPPLDPVNAMLSFGYTLMLAQVVSAINIVGLDPFLGALHEPLPGRPSLACDLLEELRAAFVDPLVVAIVNKGALGAEDFEGGGMDDGVMMRPEARRWFLELFERRLARGTPYKGKSQPWRTVILEQTRAMARHVLGTELYVPYRVR